MKLLEISKPLSWSLEAWFLAIDSFPKELLGRYLDSAGGLVLDPWRPTRRLHIERPVMIG
jgi:hypothetical protein